jgi:hypothetical protein
LNDYLELRACRVASSASTKRNEARCKPGKPGKRQANRRKKVKFQANLSLRLFDFVCLDLAIFAVYKTSLKSAEKVLKMRFFPLTFGGKGARACDEVPDR